jgi:hypothetical protein
MNIIGCGTMLATIIIIVLASTTPVNASHLSTHTKANLPCCETGVGVRFGIDCGPAICGFGVLGAGK